MKIKNTEIYGLKSSFRAMRNPMNSWEKSDSEFGSAKTEEKFVAEFRKIDCAEAPLIGSEDLKLACKLIRGGSEHRKFLRQIMVWVDFTLPRYIWTELDTYKVATVRNSCSTMHKLGRQELTVEDFENRVVLPETLKELNAAGLAFREKSTFHPLFVPHLSASPLEGYDIVRYMKAILPEGFLQKATMTFNYETLLSMYFQRKTHRLPEWSGANGICKWIECLPYMHEFIEAARRD